MEQGEKITVFRWVQHPSFLRLYILNWNRFPIISKSLAKSYTGLIYLYHKGTLYKADQPYDYNLEYEVRN
jgi:hypothetical protein